MPTANKRPKATFPTSKHSKVGDFILNTRTILLDIGNNPTIFVSPVPTLASISTNVTNLETAEALANTRVAGSVGARDLKYDVLLKSVHGLLNYVQTLADNAVDEATAISIINASGFDIRAHGVKTKGPLTAKNGKVSGSVDLVAKAAAPRSSYNWRYSIDNATWILLPTTLQSKTTVTGLTPATKVYFQCQPVIKAGAGNWSEIVSVVVQ